MRQGVRAESGSGKSPACGDAFMPVGSGGLAFRNASCLKLRSRYSDCSLCADACPTGAVQVGAESLEVSNACIACGRCASACPTGALRFGRISEASQLTPPALEAATLEIECERVPAAALAAGALRVPCTGGFGAHDLLGMYADRGCRPVRVIDRGLCADCPARGGDRHPAAAIVNSAHATLSELGPAHQQGLGLEVRALPRNARALPPPRCASSPDPSRRRFLRRLAGASPEPAGENLSQRASRNITSIPRQRLVAALDTIAESTGDAVSARVFPAIRIGDACRDHVLCASLCPTGALTRYNQEGVRGIRFAAENCIACGACERGCPEQAISVTGRGESPFRHGSEALTAFPVHSCSRCDDDFIEVGGSERVDGEERLCPACAKDVGLFHDSGLRGADSGALKEEFHTTY